MIAIVVIVAVSAAVVLWLVWSERRWGNHVPQRCTPTGCVCPCGFCRHDRRHVPGGGG